jgi:hypothetical protein
MHKFRSVIEVPWCHYTACKRPKEPEATTIYSLKNEKDENLTNSEQR